MDIKVLKRYSPMIFTLVQVITCPYFAYSVPSTQVTLADPRINPQNYPQYYFEGLFAPYMLLFTLCFISFVRAAISDPGSVYAIDTSIDKLHNVRQCRSCGTHKIHRSHHCSVCNKCSVRLDHHCKWVNNCIGIRNYKFFYLFTFYLIVCST